MAGVLHKSVLSALACAFVLSVGVAGAGADPVDPCDPVDPAACMLPFPNDYFTRADPTTDTGKRLDFQITGMPRNAAGVPIDPTEWNRNDGFSPGTLITTRVPGLDSKEAFAATGAVPISDIARYADPDQPLVVINADTGERQPIWSELDVNPPNAADRTLIIRPAVNFQEGARYIVALRNLKTATGETIPANAAFKSLRDDTPGTDAKLEARRAHFEELFGDLADAGIARDSLYLAWDFTVASERNLTERMLFLRDDAFTSLGDGDMSDLQATGVSPKFKVTSVTDYTPAEDSKIMRHIEGRVIVPCYLNAPGCPAGSRFAYGPDGLPLRIPGNVAAAPFYCNVPRSAVDGDTVKPARPSLYGHGLLGDGSQVDGGALKSLSNEHNIMLCATDWSGMSTEDLPNAVGILANLSQFPSLADRGQQGMLNFLFLGRTMIRPDGLSSDPAFQVNGQSLIDTSRLYYDGGSQGGIMGGSLTAVAPDFTRAALGVPGMNYSTLLRRSIDFDTYAEVMYRAYPNELERPLLLGVVQTLWDRAESNGYAHHITSDPLADTPKHEVMLGMAFGDHQVTNWATMVMARTVGARLRAPELDPGRSPEVQPFWNIPRVESYPYSGGSFIEVADVGPLRTLPGGQVKGTNPPPTDEVPNREGVDPHGPDQSEQVWYRQQISDFLRPDAQSRIFDTCGDHPCYIDGWLGPQ